MLSSADHRPLITLLVSARNDNYMGNFRWRLVTMINFIAEAAERIGRLREVEIMVCDWNSDVPLHKEIPLSPLSAQITRFVVVRRDVAEKVQGESNFPDPISNNVAARHSTGRFLGYTGTDILYPSGSLLALFSVLENKIPGVDAHRSVLIGGRRHIPVHMTNRQPSLQTLVGYVNRNATFFPLDPGGVGNGAPTNLIMVSRERWHECGGVDEKLVHWGWTDVDFVLRNTQDYALVHLDHFGVNLLHLEHWTKPRNYDPTKMHKRMNRANETSPFRVNGDDWGLGDYPLECFRAENIVPAEEPTRPPGTLEQWPATLQQALLDMNGKEVVEMVQGMTRAAPQMPPPMSEIPAYQLATWYAMAKHPLIYVETAQRYAYAAALVTRANPGTEMYALTAWQRPGPDEHLFPGVQDSLTTIAHIFLRQLGQHWAYSRLVGGDPATGLARLFASHPEGFAIDLAFVRATAEAPEQMVQIAERLNPGGAIVLTATSPAAYQQALGPMQAKYPQFLVLTLSDNVNGIVFAARFAEPS